MKVGNRFEYEDSENIPTNPVRYLILFEVVGNNRARIYTLLKNSNPIQGKMNILEFCHIFCFVKGLEGTKPPLLSSSHWNVLSNVDFEQKTRLFRPGFELYEEIRNLVENIYTFATHSAKTLFKIWLKQMLSCCSVTAIVKPGQEAHSSCGTYPFLILENFLVTMILSGLPWRSISWCFYILLRTPHFIVFRTSVSVPLLTKTLTLLTKISAGLFGTIAFRRP